MTPLEELEFAKYSKFIVICGRCSGTGLEPGSYERPYVKCKQCDGKGQP